MVVLETIASSANLEMTRSLVTQAMILLMEEKAVIPFLEEKEAIFSWAGLEQTVSVGT